MNLFLFQNPKRLCPRAFGTLLLALPLSGITFQAQPVQAQPAPSLPARKSSLSLGQKAVVAKILRISRQGTVCKNHVDFQVQHATVQDVVAHVKEVLPGQIIPIEVRGAKPISVGFNLKNARLGDILGHVAGLAGCKLWMLSSGLLIAPESLLTSAERADVKQQQGGEWAKSAEAGASDWSNQRLAQELFVTSVAHEVTGSAATPQPAVAVKASFGNFSPESQAMLQQLVDWALAGVGPSVAGLPPFQLSAGSPVSVDTSKPNAISIGFDPGTSDPDGTSIGITIYPQPVSPGTFNP